MDIAIVLFEGFEEMDALAPFSVFQQVTMHRQDMHVRLVSYDGAEEVTAAHGLRVRVDETLSLESPPDVLIVPGGGWASRAERGAWAEAEQGVLPAHLARFKQAGVTMGAVCTGSLLLAKAGLLAGRPATTHHLAIEDLRAAGAQIINARVVDDGDVVTAGGVTSGLDLALWLIERYFGAEIAISIESLLEYERRGTVWQHGPQTAKSA
ncbi:DJ-1/PfpI family protein [Ktedonosporobacter rubrisoli]|uniref:DJ-1/PfpI family protein n=1 Tax=Ktedonosporobacter rubrisoli TaxID=2509675 RepID=A0A4P6JN96_KTERU|nr:DJ-1/PfpI family protein [Ktedonosporobacter rubrisoli]QBD76705.1 DJ-1/PfpI family protein [Ktedonosporobacter rubrisoli]